MVSYIYIYRLQLYLNAAASVAYCGTDRLLRHYKFMRTRGKARLIAFSQCVIYVLDLLLLSRGFVHVVVVVVVTRGKMCGPLANLAFVQFHIIRVRYHNIIIIARYNIIIQLISRCIAARAERKPNTGYLYPCSRVEFSLWAVKIIAHLILYTTPLPVYFL